jgi:tetratricopeptide (TPR) repeat protein
LELSRGRLQDAASLAGDVQAASHTAELEFAILETLVALGKAAEKSGKIDQAKKWQNECAAVLPQLEQRYGVYWRHRGELLVVRSASSGTTRTSLDLLARTADDLYLRKEYLDAVAAYDKAAEMAKSLSEPKRQFELLYRGALILQEQEQHAEAAKRFRELSTRLAEDPRSDQAQLLAAWNAAQGPRQDPETMRQYVEILEEHLRLWPASDSANQVRQWLAQVHESRREWEPAIALYQRVDAGSPQYGSVLTALCNDWMRLVAEASEARSQGDLAARARESLDEIVTTVSSEEATKWRQPLQQVSMTLARLHLQYGGKPERAQQILESLRRSFQEGVETENAAIRAEAEALLVVAMASQPTRQAEAQALLQQLAEASPASLMEMIEGLARIETRSKGGTNKVLAELALQAIRTLETKRSSLSAPQQLRLDTIAASALATTGQRAEAVSRYAKLAQANPNDGAIQEGYARLLLEGEDRASWQAALDQWRRVSSKSPPQTERWYRAKYSVALAQYRLGQKEQAAQLIRFLIETPPGLANCPIEREFQELLAKCQRP